MAQERELDEKHWKSIFCGPFRVADCSTIRPVSGDGSLVFNLFTTTDEWDYDEFAEAKDKIAHIIVEALNAEWENTDHKEFLKETFDASTTLREDVESRPRKIFKDL